MIPRGIRAPSLWKRSGVLRNSIVSVSSSFASSQPATSASVIGGSAPGLDGAAGAFGSCGVAGMIVRNWADVSRVGALRVANRMRTTMSTPMSTSGRTNVRRILDGSLGVDEPLPVWTLCHASVVRRSPYPRLASPESASAGAIPRSTWITWPSFVLAVIVLGVAARFVRVGSTVIATTSPASMWRSSSRRVHVPL